MPVASAGNSLEGRFSGLALEAPGWLWCWVRAGNRGELKGNSVVTRA